MRRAQFKNKMTYDICTCTIIIKWERLTQCEDDTEAGNYSCTLLNSHRSVVGSSKNSYTEQGVSVYVLVNWVLITILWELCNVIMKFCLGISSP